MRLTRPETAAVLLVLALALLWSFGGSPAYKLGIFITGHLAAVAFIRAKRRALSQDAPPALVTNV